MISFTTEVTEDTEVEKPKTPNSVLSVPSVVKHSFQRIENNDYLTQSTLLVSKTATGFFESSAKICAPRKISSISSCLRRI